MIRVSCPACGAQLTFRSSASVFGVCPYCHSTVVRHDVNVEALGKMAELPPDTTPLQIGATGYYEKTGFAVVGRLKLSWAEGEWNEWYLWFDDGQQGWLAEAQGQYMINFAAPSVPKPTEVPPADEIHAGNTYHLGDYGDFVAEDLKEATCVGAQGELPMDASVGRKHFNVDLSADGERFACIDYSADGTILYVGKYVELEKLKLVGLRAETDDGQTTTGIAPPKLLSCPGCGANITLHAVGATLSIACAHCGAVLDAKNENYKILSQAQANLHIKPLIPLGTRGTLRGVSWDVIGFMQRSDGGIYNWREYLLYDRIRGFRWLVEAQGHWTFVTTLTDRPKTSSRRAFYKDDTYLQFEEGTAVVQYVAGEFYWRVKVDEENKVSDYICPPKMLSYEAADGERIWSLGEYLEPSEISTGFPGCSALPWRTGVGPCQPSPSAGYDGKLRNCWLVAAGALLVIQLFSLAFTPGTDAYNQNFSAPSSDPSAPAIVSPSFELKGGTTNANILLQAPVNNNWLELNTELVGETNEFSEEFDLGVEYYQGYDEDGHWSEGSHYNDFLVSSVPEGRYHLVMKPSGTPMSFSVWVKRGVPMWSNFWVILLLMSIYPAWVLFAAHRFEISRWSNSDFTPTGNRSAEEDE